MNREPCSVCGAPARFYPAGWLCSDHTLLPAPPTPDPSRTMAALVERRTRTLAVARKAAR